MAPKLPEYPEDALPIDPKLLTQSDVRVGWFTGSTTSSRVIARTISPAHAIGGNPDTGESSKLVVDVTIEGRTHVVIPNVPVRSLFDAEDRPGA